jgi:phosphate transport system permease protein
MDQLQTVSAESAPPPEEKKFVKEAATPARFQPSKTVLFWDRFMTHFIKVGGIAIITAVLGIFAFILWQIIPLFSGAEVSPMHVLSVPDRSYRILAVDEWGQLPMLVDDAGKMIFISVADGGKLTEVVPEFTEEKSFSTAQYKPGTQGIVFGTKDGHFSIVSIGYQAVFDNNQRRVIQNVETGPFYPIGVPKAAVVQLDYGDSGTERLIAALQNMNGASEVHVATLTQTRTLFGTGDTTIGTTYNLTPEISGDVTDLAVNAQGSEVVVANQDGDIFYFSRSGGDLPLVQKFRPFEDLKEQSIESMDFLLGGVSLVFTNRSGINRIFSLYVPAGGERRLFGQTKEFESLPAGASYYSPSLRNKAFLIGSGNFASLRYGTTEDVRWQKELEFTPQLAAIGGKYDLLLFLDAQKKLHFYRLKDHHPETSWKALFGKVWYEGYSEPSYQWQSTGGTDDFESKFSLVPLLIGTLKGTFYAMIFAVPIALLAAIYTSQFLHPNFRIIVKPTMEIMASLPSVVLGFLAALWLAPLLETRIPSILVALILIPALALLFGWLWSRLPVRMRVWIKPGYEWIAFIPMLFAAGYIAWTLGPVVERMFFVVTDPETGRRLADFRSWWVEVTNLPFEQRNSLVVGFMMGFAVIPIIFTITEDSLSNVPAALRSGSLALGASRWQTALRIVLPTASAGIFSAIMIGLGRAIGETMIVVMATGNTPIMDFNIFSGMRTLSANIAVELPEAPVEGTLFRTLFLGGMALFILTFVINTFAEILRQHLREKYKTV